MPKYLKDYVKEAGGVLLMVIDSIGSPHQNDRGKDVRHVSFKLKSTGTMLSEDVFNIKFVKFGLKGAKQGDNVEAFITPEGYVDYRIVSASAEQSAPMMQTPHQQIQGERKVAESVEEEEKRKAEEDAKWRRIDLSKIIFGFMNTAMSLGKTPAEAKLVALDAYQNQEQAVTEIMLGVPAIPASDVKVSDLPF